MIRTGERIAPFQGIRWAENKYDPKTGDLTDSSMGVTRLRLGRTGYSLRETSTGLTYLEMYQAEEDPRHIILVGYPSEVHRFRIIGRNERPFAIEDPSRINDSLECARKLGQTDTSYYSAIRVRTDTDILKSNLKSIAGNGVADLADAVAVIEDRMNTLISDTYPREYLAAATQMEELGIHEIRIASGVLLPGERPERDHSFTVDHLKKHFGKIIEDQNK